VRGRGAKTDPCGRSFAVLSIQVSKVGMRLRHKISAWCPGRCPGPRPMPAAVASRCCRRRFKQLACACAAQQAGVWKHA
jgi:hypothetical protein